MRLEQLEELTSVIEEIEKVQDLLNVVGPDDIEEIVPYLKKIREKFQLLEHYKELVDEIIIKAEKTVDLNEIEKFKRVIELSTLSGYVKKFLIDKLEELKREREIFTKMSYVLSEEIVKNVMMDKEEKDKVAKTFEKTKGEGVDKETILTVAARIKHAAISQGCSSDVANKYVADFLRGITDDVDPVLLVKMERDFIEQIQNEEMLNRRIRKL